MMIWCGKQYLGQRDQVTQEVKVEGANSKEELRALLDAMAKRASDAEPVETPAVKPN